jgi:hypothetical protein
MLLGVLVLTFKSKTFFSVLLLMCVTSAADGIKSAPEENLPLRMRHS